MATSVGNIVSMEYSLGAEFTRLSNEATGCPGMKNCRVISSPSALYQERRQPDLTMNMFVATSPASSKTVFAGSCLISCGMSLRICSIMLQR